MDPNSLYSDPFFEHMYSTIHVDKKYMTYKDSQKYYLHPYELGPYRTCKSKRFIQKIMFLAAVARPRFNAQDECTFDGKLGIFPIYEVDASKKKSKNKGAGTLELTPMTSFTKYADRRMLITQHYQLY